MDMYAKLDRITEAARALLVALDSHFTDEPFIKPEVEALRAALEDFNA